MALVETAHRLPAQVRLVFAAGLTASPGRSRLKSFEQNPEDGRFCYLKRLKEKIYNPYALQVLLTCMSTSS